MINSNLAEKFETKYGLPQEVAFCKKCVMSNQRPASAIEFRHTINSKGISLLGNNETNTQIEKVREKKNEENIVIENN